MSRRTSRNADKPLSSSPFACTVFRSVASQRRPNRSADFAAALKLIEHRIIKVAPLISHRFDLGDTKEAFETTANRLGLKSMVLTG